MCTADNSRGTKPISEDRRSTNRGDFEEIPARRSIAPLARIGVGWGARPRLTFSCCSRPCPARCACTPRRWPWRWCSGRWLLCETDVVPKSRLLRPSERRDRSAAERTEARGRPTHRRWQTAGRRPGRLFIGGGFARTRAELEERAGTRSRRLLVFILGTSSGRGEGPPKRSSSSSSSALPFWVVPNVQLRSSRCEFCFFWCSCLVTLPPVPQPSVTAKEVRLISGSDSL